MTQLSSKKSGREPVRVGLVGCGWIAEIAHLPALARTRNADLVAASEPLPQRAQWLKARLPHIRMEALDRLLDSPDVDAVIVAVPSGQHASVASAAFRAGKHVYVEKPLAATLDQGREIVEAWRDAGTVGMVGYNFRRSRIFEQARLTLESGELGSLTEIQTAFLWAAERIEGWRADPEQGGGVLLDLASHHVDLAVALTGSRVNEVQCTVRSIRTPEDSATLELSLAGETRAQVLASFATGAQVNRLDLFGTSGSLRVDILDPVPHTVERPPGPGARLLRARRALSGFHPIRLLRSPRHEPSFSASLEAFFQAARNGTAVGPTPEDALHTLAVVEAARASAASNGSRWRIGPGDTLSPS